MKCLEGDIVEISHKGIYIVRRIMYSTSLERNRYVCVSDELRTKNTSQWYGVHELLSSPYLYLEDVLLKYQVEKIGTIWDKGMCKKYGFKPNQYEYKLQALLDALMNLDIPLTQ